MILIDIYFNSYEIIESPKIIGLNATKIGQINFYPNNRNIFFEQTEKPTIVFLYDDYSISCDEKMIEFISYTNSESEFVQYCFEVSNKILM